MRAEKTSGLLHVACGEIQRVRRGAVAHDLHRHPPAQAVIREACGLGEDGGLDQLAGAIVGKGAHGVALRVFGQQLPSRRPVVGVRAPIAHGAVGEAIGGIVGVRPQYPSSRCGCRRRRRRRRRTRRWSSRRR